MVSRVRRSIAYLEQKLRQSQREKVRQTFRAELLFEASRSSRKEPYVRRNYIEWQEPLDPVMRKINCLRVCRGLSPWPLDVSLRERQLPESQRTRYTDIQRA